MLNFGLLAGLQVAGVGLARQGVDDGRLRLGWSLGALVSEAGRRPAGWWPCLAGGMRVGPSGSAR